VEQNDADVTAFVDGVADEQRRADAHRLVELIGAATGEPATMWGSAIIGFGRRHYKYESGREGDTVAVGFSPRKAQTAIYLTGPLEDYADLLDKLGPHSTGKGCLYLKRVDRVDPAILRAIVIRSYEAAAAG
jgi:Domain of unknown function (DU1801)